MDEQVNILIVDDLPEKLLVFQSILEELQQNLVMVRSGREALQQLLERDFAVILLDVNMPDIDGFETARLIRQYRRTRQTPIVFITAYLDEIQTVRGYALGAVDYIATPVVPEILRSKVKVFVDLYRMHNQLRRQAEEREALARAQAARAAAEQAMRRADLLAEASHILTRSLDIDTTIQRLLGFAVPQFSQLGIVALFGERGEIMRSNIAWHDHAYRQKESATLPVPMIAAITQVNIDEDMLTFTALTDWQVQIIGEKAEDQINLEIDSAKILPLFTRGRAIGAIVLGCADRMPHDYSNDDTLLKEIASRAAIAIENALLYRAIRDGDRRKNEFLAMLAHELRNPLAPIRNAVHVLQLDGTAKEEWTWATEVIGRQVDHMARMMDDLLDVSRIARGTVSIQHEKVLLSNVIERSVETCRPLIDERSDRLWLDMPHHEVALHGDLVRLAQIFSNLLNNAVKYSPPGSDIWIKADFQGDHISVSVRDNGEGISAEFMPHIFDLFAQGDKSIDRTQSGLGVGLTLVKHLIDLHHGSIEAKSAGASKGTEFTVALPARRHDRIAVSVAPDKPRALVGGRVLIVDDLQASAESMKLLLKMKGYEVEAVFDGPTALTAVADFQPDVILLDIGLPGMDGFEVARQLRRGTATPQPFLIALTGYGQEADRVAATDAGFDAHIVKPADIDVLLKLIHDYCAAHAEQAARVAHG
ncbi:MAG TPA: response regulator [Spongiibacteraceae bacterium]|jgi:signal transduction histidine kinase/DNA-binding response OmpR family regulator